ncbi:MAG: TonB-dependent receptor [Alphaproteobacteria bacterium]|nr:MAG: TonB-dependent receptor [Alphaproteobacteria bacterium]
MHKFLNLNLKSTSMMVLSTSLLATGLMTSSTFAAEEKSVGLEEIVITARKVSESLQDVPIAVSAFTADSLQKKGLSNISEIGDYTPSLIMDFTSALTGSSASITTFIRGIGQSDFLLTIDPGVGLYVDGVYVARSVGGIVDLLNLQRIEVLKGPQGTLFGRNTIGGAINIVSAMPGEEFALKADATIGSYNRRDLRMTADIPLIEDKLLSSLSFSTKNRDGYAKRIPFTGEHGPDISYPDQAIGQNTELGDENTFTAKGIFQLNATDRLQATLIVDATRSRAHSAVSKLLNVYPGATQLAGLYNGCIAGAIPVEACGPAFNLNGDANPLNDRTPYDDRFLTDDPFTTYGTGPNFSNLDLFGIALTLDYAVNDNVDFKSITAYRKLDAEFGRDGDNSPVTIDHTSNLYEHSQFTQELQLTGLSMDGKLKWLAGLYYFEESGRDNVFVPLGGLPFLSLDELNIVNNVSYAAFGQASYSITDDLSITAGIRYTKENKDYRPVHIETVSGAMLVPDDTAELDITDTSPRIGVEYRWNDNLFTYVSVSKGFKSGGFTGRTVDPQPAARPFKPEKVWAYEVGFKSDLADGRVRLNGAAYYTDYSNLQVVNQEGITPITVNAGKAEIKGAELELQAMATDNLVLTVGLAYTDAKYVEISDPFATISLASKFANTPEFSSTVGVEYTVDLDNEGTLMVHGDWNYNSTIYNNAENTPELTQPALHLFNAAVTYSHPGEQWELILGGRNLSDEKYLISGFNQPGVGFTEGTYARPREWYLTLRMSY